VTICLKENDVIVKETAGGEVYESGFKKYDYIRYMFKG